MENSKIITAAKKYRDENLSYADDYYAFIAGFELCIDIVLEIINTNEDLANVWTTENLVKEIQSLKTQLNE